MRRPSTEQEKHIKLRRINEWLCRVRHQIIDSPEDHECCMATCRDFREPISFEHDIFGCALSGRIHLCKQDDNCRWRYSHEGNEFCVLSTFSISPECSFLESTSSKYDKRMELSNRDMIVLGAPKDQNNVMDEIFQKKETPEERFRRVLEDTSQKRQRPEPSQPKRNCNTGDPGKQVHPRWFSIVCDQYQNGNAFVEFCQRLEADAETLCTTLMCPESPLRRLYRKKWNIVRAEKTREMITQYVTRMYAVNMMPNMHIMDNIYESRMCQHRDGPGVLSDKEARDHLKTLCKSFVSLWMVFMIAIGGHPFRDNPRGKALVSAIFHTKNEKETAKKAKASTTTSINGEGSNVHLFSYFSSFRKFTMACLSALGGKEGIVMTWKDEPVLPPLFPHEPMIIDALPTITNEGLVLVKQCMEELTRNRGTHAKEVCIKITRNGSLFSDNSTKTSGILYKKFIKAIDMAEMHHMVSGVIDVIRHNVVSLRQELEKKDGFITLSGYTNGGEKEEEEENIRPVKRRFVGVTTASLPCPYTWIADQYAAMGAL